MSGALADLLVVDISATPAGAWSSRTLASMGADVVMVEGPEGHPLRHQAPFAPDGSSILAAYFLGDRRSVSLDLDRERDQGLLKALLARADVLISSSPPSELSRRGLQYSQLGLPALVMAHITHHGMTGPLAEVPGNDLTVAARSGWASINGDDDREPLKPSGWQSSYATGVVAAAAVAAAIRYRDHHPNEGQEVDVAELEVMAAFFAPAILRSQYAGEVQARRSDSDLLAGPEPVADGYFALTLSRAHFWRDAMYLLGLPDLAEDERYEAAQYRRQHRKEYGGRVLEQMAKWKKMDLFEELAVRRVVAGPVLTMAELTEVEHLRERGFWTRVTGAAAGLEVAGPPFKSSATPLTVRGLAPKLGEHTDEALREVRG